MKKAKLMLVGIACMAVVGGAYAIKAQRTVASVYCPTTAGTTALAISKVPYSSLFIDGAASTTKPCAFTLKYGTTTALPANLTGTVFATIL